MRFREWIWAATLSLMAGAACGEEGVRIGPGGVMVFPRSAKLGIDPPIRFLKEFADNYQALKARKMPPKLGEPVWLATNMVSEPENCMAPQAMHPFLEL